jgi:predicted PurR-regulated permease PerM
MREADNPRTTAQTLNDRVARLEGRLALLSTASPLNWMRWVPVAILALVVVGALLFGARIVLVPLLSSVALAYLMAPIANWFERRGWSRSTASILALISATLVTVLLLIFILPNLWAQLHHSYEQGRALVTDQARVDRTLERVRQMSPAAYKYLQDAIGDLDDPAKEAQLRGMAVAWLQRGLFGLVNLTTSIVDLLLIPFFVFYLLCDYREVRSRIDSLIPPRHRAITGDLIHQLNRVISTYIRSQMLIGLTMGVLYGIGFMILRVPLGLTIGLAAGLLNFIPYLGTLIGLVLALGFVALDGAGFGRISGVLGIFAAVQMLEGYYLTPRFLSTSLNLHPMLVLLGLMIGGSLFGLLGIILAVPVVAAGKVILDLLETHYRESAFYRRTTSELLTEAGNPAELMTDSAPVSSTPIITADLEPRQPRIVITTGELRSRLPKIAPEDR